MKSIIENATIEIKFNEQALPVAMAEEIIRSIQQCNYGIAEIAATVLLNKLEREARERREAVARQRNADATAAENRDRFTLAADKEPDAFEAAMEPVLDRHATVLEIALSMHPTGTALIEATERAYREKDIKKARLLWKAVQKYNEAHRRICDVRSYERGEI